MLRADVEISWLKVIGLLSYYPPLIKPGKGRATRTNVINERAVNALCSIIQEVGVSIDRMS